MEFIVFRRFLTPKALYSKAQGQCRRESGRATLGDCRAERLTPKALYRTVDGRFILVEHLRRTCFLRRFPQGARPTTATPRQPRPWALEYNRFAVKSQTAALRMMRSTKSP